MIKSRPHFVSRQGIHFYRNEARYPIVGTNLWYAANLASTEEGRIRLDRELELLKNHGINNVRILASSEAAAFDACIRPAMQMAPGVYSEAILCGLDYVLAKLGERDMTAVVYFGNYWDWSGGFLQYIAWADGVPVYDHARNPGVSYDVRLEKASSFYSNEKANGLFRNLISDIIARTNTVNGLKYLDDPAIMTWEVANEPRAWEGIEPGASFDSFLKWCDEICGFIKSQDPHHLVTLGSEGAVGCCDRLDIFELAHSSPHIDYTTAHIWPKNRGWFRDATWQADLAPSIQKAMDYLHAHESVSRRLNRPLVIEEFGLSRDAGECAVETSTTARDEFFRTIFNAVVQAPPESALAGFNFWSWGGYGRAATNTIRPFTHGPEDFKWRQGDEWLGDPPEEAQGLNSIFDVDMSTLEIIHQTARDIFCATNVMPDPGPNELRKHSELAKISDEDHVSLKIT